MKIKPTKSLLPDDLSKLQRQHAEVVARSEKFRSEAEAARREVDRAQVFVCHKAL